jgi:hypothetical protein
MAVLPRSRVVVFACSSLRGCRAVLVHSARLRASIFPNGHKINRFEHVTEEFLLSD